MIARFQRAGATVVEFPVEWTDVPGSTFDIRRHGVPAFAELAGIARTLRAPSGRVAGAAARARRARGAAGHRGDRALSQELEGRRVAVVNWRDRDHSLAGGAEIYAWEFARALRDGGATVDFLTAREAGQEPEGVEEGSGSSGRATASATTPGRPRGCGVGGSRKTAPTTS